LPEYLHRSPQKPRIQIVLSTSGFIGGVKKSVPFKVFIINGQEKFAVLNFKILLNNARQRNINFPSLSTFSPMQQYVLNLLNELLTMELRDSGFVQPQFRIRRMQWAVYLGVIAACPGVEFVESKTNRSIVINKAGKITLTVRIRLIEKGQWGVKVAFKDPQNDLRDFSGVHLQEGQPVWLFDELSLSFQPMHESITYPFLMDFLNTERILDLPQIPYFISEVLNPLRGVCEIIEEGDCLKETRFITPALRCRLDLNYIKDSLRARLSFIYEGQEAYPYEGNVSIERFVEKDGQDGLSFVVHDLTQENAQVQYLLRECLFEWRKNTKDFVLSGTGDILGFVYQKLPMLKNQMDVFCSKDFESKLLNNKFFEPVMRLTGHGIDWFKFDAVYKAEGTDEEITHARMKKLVLRGQNYIRLKKGEILPIPREYFDRIESMEKEFDAKKKHLAQMPFVMEEIKRHGFKSTLDPDIKALYEELKSFQSIETIKVPVPLSGILRDYQKKGVEWLAFLKKFRFGGVLADEMGLGKTLQALTMVQIAIEEGEQLPSLVVCPTTLVWNWQEEIKKFLPGVRTLALKGNHRRELFDEISRSQIVITSYSLLRRDIEFYKKMSFNYVILDEAQNIKNRNTRNALVAKSLKASMRLAMTGTPVENSIMDLWSIFDFLMPGFFGRA